MNELQETAQDVQTQNEQKKTVYINIPAAFVQEGLIRKDNNEEFNLVTLPKNTIINGQDVGSYKFSPLYVNKPAKFDGHQMILGDDGQPVIREDSKMRVIPCVAGKELWLQKKDCETVKVTPEVLKEALAEGRKQYRAQNKQTELTAEEVRSENAQITPAKETPKHGRPKVAPPAESIAAAKQEAQAYNAGLSNPTQSQKQTI